MTSYQSSTQSGEEGLTASGKANITVATGYATITVASAGMVAGTNAPYIQLLACQKN